MSEKKIKNSVFFSRKLVLMLVFALGLVLGGSGVYLYYMINTRTVNQTIVESDLQNLDDVNLNDSDEVVYQVDTSIVYPDTIPDSEAYKRIWISLISEPGYREMDSLFLDSIVKRIYADSVMQTHYENYDMYLQNEELLSAKYLNVETYAHADDSVQTLETLATGRYYVEFWKSPINFEGYVKTGKSIKLYSVQPGESVSFVLIDTALYMLRNKKWYILLETAKEKSFTPVFDAGILEILSEVK